MWICFLWNFAAYCVVAKESVGKQVSIAFLERMKADFKKRYGGGKADTATAKSLNKDFGYVNLRNILEDDILISLCIWMRICWKK